MRTLHPFIASILISIGSIAISVAQERLTVEVFLDSLAKPTAKTVLDVRTTDEYAKGSLATAQNIDWNNKKTFPGKIEKLDRAKPVYLFCQSGGRSAKAAQFLKKKGFRVYELQGGFMQVPEEKRVILSITDQQQKPSLTVAAYRELTRSHPTVLINFTADWCAPCQALKPIVEKIAQDEQLGVHVIYIDADQNKGLLNALDVRLIPYFEIYRDGKQIWHRTGRITEKRIRKVLQVNE